MLRKVFKTILLFTICLGITIPANAGNLSVSDGSAFITKSELTYELNNLSNRMTQLEHSLDSKIDRLVSSYLTRNGIWNGVEQTFDTNQLSVTGDRLQNAFAQRGKYYSLPNDSTASDFIGNYTLVNQISKTGMISIKIKANGYAQATKYGQHFGTQNVGTGNIYVTFNAGSEVKYTASIGKLDSSGYWGTNSGGDYLILATTDLWTVAQFFVQKMDQLDWDIFCYFNSNGVPAISWGSTGTTTVTIESANIY